MTIAVPDLERGMEGWILEGEYRGHSARTLEERRRFTRLFAWLLAHRGFTAVGTQELRATLAYVRQGHLEPGGRWGNPTRTKPVSSRTVEFWYDQLSALMNYLVEDGLLPESPMAGVKPPGNNADDIQPFTLEQMEALLSATRKTTHRKRDEALVLLLWDTGIRATELCALTLADLDFQAHSLKISGKGDKERRVHFGELTKKTLWRYVQEDGPRSPERPLFLSDRGKTAGEALTRNGLFQLIERLGAKAGVQSVRCSPHTLRHTFAVDWLRNGGDAFSLQIALGHTSQTMTAKYVKLAQADLQAKHRLCSPVDRARKKPQ